MKIYKVTIQIIDFDELGEDEIISEIENVNFPNDCLHLQVRDIESRELGEWDDELPINQTTTAEAEFWRLFD